MRNGMLFFVPAILFSGVIVGFLRKLPIFLENLTFLTPGDITFDLT